MFHRPPLKNQPYNEKSKKTCKSQIESLSGDYMPLTGMYLKAYSGYSIESSWRQVL